MLHLPDKKYWQYLDDKKQDAIQLEKSSKRKLAFDEVEQLRKKRRLLETDITNLTTSANNKAKDAEVKRDFTLIGESSALRDKAIIKQKEADELLKMIQMKEASV